MANNKVQLADGTVLIDLTGDNVQPGNVEEGITFHDASGTQRSGTLQRGAQVASGSVKLGTNERTVTVTPGFIVGKFMIVWSTLTTGTTTKQAGAYYSGDSFDFYNTAGGMAYCTLITNTVESFSFKAPSTFTKGTYKWLATS